MALLKPRRALSIDVRCPICNETMEKPRMLRCHHFACLDCLMMSEDGNNLKKPRAKDVYICSVCHQTTTQEELVDAQIVADLLEADENAKKEFLSCHLCKRDTPKYRCRDCKACYCTSCKSNHDLIPTCSRHKCAPLDEGDNLKLHVDKVVFCRVHADKMVELNCRDCEKMICVLCKASEHHQHTAETIAEALERLRPRIQENKLKLQEQVDHCDEAVADLQRKAAQVESHFMHVKGKADEQLRTVIDKANADHEELIQELTATKDKDLEKLGKSIEKVRHKSKSVRDSIYWVEDVMSNVYNSSLLQELQSGPSSHRLLKIKPISDVIEPVTEFSLNVNKLNFQSERIPKGNIVGVLKAPKIHINSKQRNNGNFRVMFDRKECRVSICARNIDELLSKARNKYRAFTGYLLKVYVNDDLKIYSKLAEFGFSQTQRTVNFLFEDKMSACEEDDNIVTELYDGSERLVACEKQEAVYE